MTHFAQGSNFGSLPVCRSRFLCLVVYVALLLCSQADPLGDVWMATHRSANQSNETASLLPHLPHEVLDVGEERFRLLERRKVTAL